MKKVIIKHQGAAHEVELALEKALAVVKAKHENRGFAEQSLQELMTSLSEIRNNLFLSMIDEIAEEVSKSKSK